MTLYKTKDGLRTFISFSPEEAIKLIASLSSQILGLPVKGKIEMYGGASQYVEFGVSEEEKEKG